ncbi:MAG: histidinol-phosphatase HisJ family protein [Clostridia bacterium]|nr:histidinol-phosphatase HisJ family protein [Clostridia bacterium]
MMLSDFHIHTKFCDGNDTPEEMIETAIERGFSVLGFSMHSPSVNYGDWVIHPERAAEYRKEIARLKEKYAGKLTILCGIEQDSDCTESTEPYEYVIASVHGVKDPNGKRWEMDWSIDHLKEAFGAFGGDPYALLESYYERVGNLTGGDIIGHFDLCTKYLEREPLFDPDHPRYREAAETAIKKLIPTGMLFEINEGAMSRGYRTSPYPAKPLLRSIYERGGEIIFNGDCHDRRFLGCSREQSVALAKACGFTRSVILTPSGREYMDF